MVLGMSGLVKFKFLERLFAPKTPVVEKEILTAEFVDKILGGYASHVVLYNFDMGKWNRDYYLWHRIMSSGVDCSAMKKEIESRYPQIELAAVVGIAAIPAQATPVMFAPKPATPHDSNCLAYATLVVRDKNTGKLRKPSCWVKLSNCPHPSFVAEAMPQLLSGVGRATVAMDDVELCFKERSAMMTMINDMSHIHYQKVLRKYVKQSKKIKRR